MSKEDAINRLYATIKSKFESDGVMQELRCILQAKMVAMMKGKTDGGITSRHHNRSSNRTVRTAPNGDHDVVHSAPDEAGDIAVNVASHDACATMTPPTKRDVRIQLLHQLIMDYLHWHGFEYTAEMFAIESSTENARPARDYLESHLAGTFKHNNLPILLEIVADLMECI